MEHTGVTLRLLSFTLKNVEPLANYKCSECTRSASPLLEAKLIMYAGSAMRLPLLPGIQVQVSMAHSRNRPADIHLDRQDHHDHNTSPRPHEQGLVPNDSQQQRVRQHTDQQQSRQRQHGQDPHTRLLKYSGQILWSLFAPA